MRLSTDKDLRQKVLGAFAPLSPPVVDAQGLTKSDYIELRRRAGLGSPGPEGLILLNLLLNRSETRSLVDGYAADAIASNRRAARLALRRSDFINKSRVVEALLWGAIERLAVTDKEGTNATVKSGGRTRRDAGKAA